MRFCELLLDLRTEPEVLHRAALAVASALDESPNVIGFRFFDNTQGTIFYVDRHDFPAARS